MKLLGDGIQLERDAHLSPGVFGRGRADSECLAHKSPRPSQPYEPEALGHCPEAHRPDPPRAAHALAHAGGLRPAALHRPAAPGDHEPLRLHLHAHLQPHRPPLVGRLAASPPHPRPQQRRHRQVRPLSTPGRLVFDSHIVMLCAF